MKNKLIDKLFEIGKEKGFEAQEVYHVTATNTSIKVYEGEIETLDSSMTGGLSYRGLINGKLGYSYTELLDESSLNNVVDEAYANASVIESSDEVFIFADKAEYKEVKTFNPKIAEIPFEDKIKIPMEMERLIKEMEPRVVEVSYNMYSESEGESLMRNTYGLNLQSKSNGIAVISGAVLKDGEEVKNAYDGIVTNDFSEVDVKKIAESIVEKAREKLGASSMPSAACDVVLDREAFASLFGAYIGGFSAESVQKNLSPFAEKLGEKIAVDNLNVTDDPHIDFGPASRAYDAEGYPTRKMNIIENGVLKTFFHNLKTAKIAGTESTGHASKGSYKGTIAVSPSNLVIEGGSLSPEQLIAKCGKGVYITEVKGLHAGVNPMSGEFSLQADGFEITDGRKGRPVNQIVLSGNYLEMLNNIIEIGNDSKNSVHTGSLYCPSVLVKGLSVSGE